jgi:hypothetical protein
MFDHIQQRFAHHPFDTDANRQRRRRQLQHGGSYRKGQLKTCGFCEFLTPMCQMSTESFPGTMAVFQDPEKLPEVTRSFCGELLDRLHSLFHCLFIVANLG